ncbi:hypothetical protein [Agrococcus terreus]|uniref:hypothetical protein n=1 Tax=Agrococcus terreus TaxID=574649 RepID=UPI0016637D3D|nr:hypothetical protein [Agrococcus terreus]
MVILVVMVLGAAIGLLARYLLPGREWVGLFLNPCAAATAAGVVWIALSLAGLGVDSGWLWIGSLVAATLVAVAIPRLLPAHRRRVDAAELDRLQAVKG